MKCYITFGALLMAASALAEVDGGNSFATLRVDSSEKQTIVAVPWVDASVSSGAIKVVDLVKTANLDEGDRLYYYDGSEWSAWQLHDNSWSPANIASTDGVSASAVASDATLARGSAIMLVRDDPSDYFYIQGQVSAQSATTTLLAGKSSFLAPPKATAFNLNSATWSTPDTTDRIYFKTATGGLMILKYDDNQWKGKVYDSSGAGSWSAEAAVLPVGTGAWYKSGGSNAVTVTWPGN